MNTRILSRMLILLGVVILFFNSPAPVGGQKRTQNDWIVPNEILVKFNQSVSGQRRSQLQNRLNSRLIRRMRHTSIEHWQLPEGESIATVIQTLNDSGQVKYAEPNYRLERRLRPNDTDFKKQWGLQNTGQTVPTTDQAGNFKQVTGVSGADMDMISAWDFTRGSQEVVIVIQDDGLDLDHPDLQANLWTNSDEVAGNGLDDDNNGYIDDVHGWDVLDNDNDPSGDGIENGHGTAVAGAAGAVGNNNTGISGPAWTISLMPIRAGLNSAQAVAGIEYAIANKADILVASWGGPGFSQALADAVSAMEDAGMLMVVASGNDGEDNDLIPDYPSNFPNSNVISVTASTAEGDSAEWARFGQTKVDIAAPGEGVYVTVDPNTADQYGVDENGLSLDVGDLYGYADGTSFSAPAAAGVAALIKAYKSPPDHKELKARLMIGIDSVGDTWDRLSATNGRLNATKALTANEGPLVVINDITLKDSSGAVVHAIGPSEAYALTIRIENIWKAATNITATLSTPESNLSITDGAVSFGDLAQNGRADPDNPFDFQTNATAITADLRFELTISADGGYEVTRRFLLKKIKTKSMQAEVNGSDATITSAEVPNESGLSLPNDFRLIASQTFTVIGLFVGDQVDVEWELSFIPDNAKFYKCQNGSCGVDITDQVTVDRTTMTAKFSVTDGGSLDDDGSADGSVTDPVAMLEPCSSSSSNCGGSGSSSEEASSGGGGGSCFIATAAYGTNSAREVELLRKFRDVHLTKYKLGHRFIALYNVYSPPMAGYIADKPVVKAVIRGVIGGTLYIGLMIANTTTQTVFLGVIGLMAVLIGFRIRFLRDHQS